MAQLKTQFSTPEKPLAHWRLLAQGLIRPHWDDPIDVVRSYGVMQGQDFGVISSVALRTTSSGDVTAVIDAMNAHQLVRGYPMRGTVFMGLAEDMRWITQLCSDGISLQGRRRSEKAYGLTAEMFDRLASEVKQLGDEGITRAQYKELVAKTLPELCDPATGKPDQGVAYRSLFQLLIEHVVVYSGWDGKDQLIFAADNILGPDINERFGGDRVAATVDLMTRYIRSHGFVTVDDFAWWSKLPKSLIKQAVLKLPEQIRACCITVNGNLDRPIFDVNEPTSAALLARQDTIHEFNSFVDVEQMDALHQNWPWEGPTLKRAVMKPMLLPAFDEFILGYQDRMFAMTTSVHEQLVPGNRGVFKKPVVIDGTVRGAWNRKGTAGKRKLDIEVYSTIAKTAYPKLEKAFQQFPFLSE